MENLNQPARRRPGGLTAVCVIAIVLGSLGLCSTLLGFAGLAAGPWMQKMIERQHRMGMNNPANDAQLEMQKKMQAVNDRHWGSNLGFMLANMVLAGGLLAGGITALGLAPKARKLLLAVFLAAIAFVIVRAIVHVSMQMEMATIISDMPGSMSRIMAASAPKGPQAARQVAQATEMAAIFAKIFVFLGMACSLVLALAETVFYAVGARYLCRPNIRRLFEE
jgi:hypothetical protein